MFLNLDQQSCVYIYFCGHYAGKTSFEMPVGIHVPDYLHSLGVFIVVIIYVSCHKIVLSS